MEDNWNEDDCEDHVNVEDLTILMICNEVEDRRRR